MKPGTVIVGASHAGVQAAASLRQAGWQEPITLISAETDLPYHRPPLSKAFLAGEKTADQILLRGGDFYASQGIEFLTGTTVDSISPRDRHIRAGGETIPYSKLILATGASARKLDTASAEFSGIYTLRDMSDARRLKDAFEEAERIVIVGGGFIGLEVASSAAKAGKSVTVIEVQERLLTRALPPRLADWLFDFHSQKGVDIRLAEGFDRFESDNGKLTAVRLASGERIFADLALVGIGSTANLGLAKEAGLSLAEGGVHVDAACLTSAADIYAIGDCTSQHNIFANKVLRIESVQNATDQARIVAAHMTGGTLPKPSTNWFWTDQYDLKIQMAGLLESDCDDILRGDPASNAFSILQMRDGKLRACFSINRPADHMAARKLIAEAAPLDRALASDAATPLARAIKLPHSVTP